MYAVLCFDFLLISSLPNGAYRSTGIRTPHQVRVISQIREWRTHFSSAEERSSIPLYRVELVARIPSVETEFAGWCTSSDDAGTVLSDIRAWRVSSVCFGCRFLRTSLHRRRQNRPPLMRYITTRNGTTTSM